MSPTTSVRPVWAWSLPAVAIIISFLWYRKKRVSIQTDTGGPGELLPKSDHIPTSQQESPANQVCVDCVSATSPSPSVQVIEKFLEKLEEQLASVEPLPTKEEEEEDCVKAEADSTYEPAQVAELPAAVEEKPTSVEELQPEEQATEVSEVEVEQPIVVEVEEEKKEEVCEVAEPVVEAKTATLVELHPKNEVQREEDVLCSPDAKWDKKRKNKKGKNLTKNAKSGDMEEQLSKLDIGGQEAGEASVGDEPKTPVSAGGERDSANTSPSEVMLASPSLSGYSDTHSEGSSDSGKGCSDVLTPSPTPVSGNSLSGDLPCDLPALFVYEFVIPQHLVGRLIGRNGAYINEVKDSTHATVYIKRHPETTKLKICAIEGTQMDIDNALEMIRRKFPKKRYPNVTLEPVELPPVSPPVLPDNMQLYLVDGVNNDVIISSLVSAGHLFVQQPIHPTFPALNQLQACMSTAYADPDLPGLPDDFPLGVLCAAPVHDGWYRASIVSVDGPSCEIKFVDFGGFMIIEKSQLRQIRSDFVTLPLQASECFLAAVDPIDGEWSAEAREMVEKLTLGNMLQAQIHGYTDSGVPLIFLYTVHNNQVVSVNEQLVSHGFAEWLLPEPVTEEGCVIVQQADHVLQPVTA